MEEMTDEETIQRRLDNTAFIKQLIAAHERPPKQPRAYTWLYLSADAWESIQRSMTYHGYQGRGPGQGVSAYLEALFTANHIIECWRDTRPDALREWDLPRLEEGLLPLWFEDNNNRQIRSALHQRNIRESAFDAILPVLIELSNHFGIKSKTQHTSRSDANCVLEAIGLGHLSPSNEPDHCPNERKLNRAVWYENRKRKAANTKELFW